MSKYQWFVFKNYEFNASTKTLELTYGLDDEVIFTETYSFDFDFVKYDESALDRALQSVFFMAGVSYFKTYLPTEIVIQKGKLDSQTAKFLSKTYQKGLGEFFYVNRLDPTTPINFKPNTEILNTLSVVGQGMLVGIGGGKDSLVSAELLRGSPNVATWSLDHRKQLEPLIQAIGLPHYWVERQWDKQLLEINKNTEAYNGHVPISAIFAATGTVVAVLSGYKDIVVSNESTASEPNLEYQDVKINHQYSKSLEFEKDYQSLLEHNFGDSIRYYSVLRPLTELKIAEIFSKVGFEKYKDVFSSCNRAFVHTSSEMSWCGECPKCAFVFLALTPFVERQKLESLWGGKNLLLDPLLEPTYRQLLGIEGIKPLECVGEIKESRAAMRLAQDIYPELKAKYVFELPVGYDLRALSEHAMPEELFAILQSALQT